MLFTRWRWQYYHWHIVTLLCIELRASCRLRYNDKCLSYAWCKHTKRRKKMVLKHDDQAINCISFRYTNKFNSFKFHIFISVFFSGSMQLLFIAMLFFPCTHSWCIAFKSFRVIFFLLEIESRMSEERRR